MADTAALCPAPVDNQALEPKKPAVLRVKRVTERNFPSYVRRTLLAFTPEIVPRFFQTLKNLVEAGDKDAMRLTAEIWGFCNRKGISVVTNVVNQNVTETHAYSARFDAIVRELDGMQP